MNHNRCLVVLPTYNERSNIEQIIPEILQQDESIDILVVDDSSPDGTGEIVKKQAQFNKRVFLLSQNSKQGLGKAYRSGFRYAIEQKYQFVIGMDADLSHDAADIRQFLQAIQSVDYVIGSRWMMGGRLLNWPWHRILLSRVANFYIYLLHGTGIHDSTSGFQCFRREVLEGIQLDQMHSQGYSFQLETKYRAYLAGFRILELPILFKDRTRGISKIPKRTVLETLWIALHLRLQAGQIVKSLRRINVPLKNVNRS